MSKCFFRRQKNSHEFFIGVISRSPSGDPVLELRLMESDGRGGSRDSRKVRLALGAGGVAAVLDLLREAQASIGGRQ